MKREFGPERSEGPPPGRCWVLLQHRVAPRKLPEAFREAPWRRPGVFQKASREASRETSGRLSKAFRDASRDVVFKYN